MKRPKIKGVLPLSFVNDKLKHPLVDADDFIDRVNKHVDEQIAELKLATVKHELPSIHPLAESVKNGMNIMDFHLADNALKKIQNKAAKMQDDQELNDLIQEVVRIWETRKKQ
ncbi:MAG: hypothetical protein FJX95_08905 [Bacteroidetes bacterium]|nr:hypothetical protein [Bacteroidota bacterium]